MLRALQVFRLARPPVSIACCLASAICFRLPGGFSLSDLLPSPSPNAPPQSTAASARGRSRSVSPAAFGGGGRTVHAQRCQMALAEFNNPTLPGEGRQARRGRTVPQQVPMRAPRSFSPLFALTVGLKASARPQRAGDRLRPTPMATRGVYLPSFLPESDVDRIISRCGRAGPVFAALSPTTARSWRRR
jgi:hypothetical protein